MMIAKASLLNCKCGAEVEVDYGGCTEFYGGTWQSVDVMCPNKCGYDASITYNADNDGESFAAEQLVVEMWNRFACHLQVSTK
jgi:hypothetical protein